jgi:hypothetical protein
MLRSASRSRTDFDVIFDEYELEAISSWTDTQRSRTLQSLRTEIPSPFVRAQVLEGVFPSIAAANSSALALTQSIDFFKKLTRTASHIGRYREFTSKMLRLPQLGDVTGDYCVNDADVAAVKAKFGATVSAGSLLDPNQDKVIDYFDYLTVMQNFGDGCPRN